MGQEMALPDGGPGGERKVKFLARWWRTVYDLLDWERRTNLLPLPPFRGEKKWKVLDRLDFLLLFPYRKERRRKKEKRFSRSFRTQTHLSLSLSHTRILLLPPRPVPRIARRPGRCWLRLKLLEFYMHVTRSFSRKFFTTTSTGFVHGTIYTAQLFSVTYRNARWRALVYPVTGLFLSSAGATTDPGPPLRFRTRLIGDEEEKRGRHVVRKGTSHEPFDYSGTLVDSRVQLVWMLSLERIARPTDRPTVSLESIFTSFLDRPINPAESRSSSRKFYSPSIAGRGASFSGT